MNIGKESIIEELQLIEELLVDHVIADESMAAEYIADHPEQFPEMTKAIEKNWDKVLKLLKPIFDRYYAEYHTEDEEYGLTESIFDFEAQNRSMYQFAKKKHDDTGAIRKHSGDPYWVHPEGVAKIAVAYGGSDIEIQAAMAHDTLEDTDCTFDEIEEMFGEEVAIIVKEITNDPEAVAVLGKEQYINQELVELSHPALFVKLCDMYYNTVDFPKEEQKARMVRNVNYLLDNREDDLNENEIMLIEDIIGHLL